MSTRMPAGATPSASFAATNASPPDTRSARLDTTSSDWMPVAAKATPPPSQAVAATAAAVAEAIPLLPMPLSSLVR